MMRRSGRRKRTCRELSHISRDRPSRVGEPDTDRVSIVPQQYGETDFVANEINLIFLIDVLVFALQFLLLLSERRLLDPDLSE